MSGPTWDFTGIQTTPDPGPVATGTVASSQIPEWIMQNVPFQGMSPELSEMFALRGDTQAPWRSPGQNFQAPEASVLDKAKQLLSLGMYTPTAIPQPDFPSSNPLLADPALTQFDPQSALAQAISKPGQRGPEPFRIPTPLGTAEIPTDPIELAVTAGGAAAGGVSALRSAEEGLLRSTLRTRMGAPANMDEIAAAVQRTAPAAMRPATATREGISESIRERTGIRALGAAKQASDDTIASELNAITAQQQAAAAAQPTALRRSLALARVRDLATEFRTLADELKDVGRMTFDPKTGQMRGGGTALASGREREAVYQEIQTLLSPDQFRRFMATQTEYAQGNVLRRLFDPKGQAADVLLDREALQKRAKFLLDQIDPDLRATIFRHGGNVAVDKKIPLPFGLGSAGARTYIKPGGTVLPGAVSREQLIGSAAVGGAAGAFGGQQAYRGLESYNPFVDDPNALRDLFGLVSTEGGQSWADFLRHLNPFVGDPMGGR